MIFEWYGRIFVKVIFSPFCCNLLKSSGKIPELFCLPQKGLKRDAFVPYCGGRQTEQGS